MDKYKAHSNVKITVRRHRKHLDYHDFYQIVHDGELDKFSEIVDVVETHNMIMNVGLNMIRDVLRGAVTDGKIKILAWGTDATAEAAGQSNLVAESGRKAVTQQTAGTTGRVLTTTYIAPNDGVGITIRELGWFAGAAATATANSGIMVARLLYTKVKTNLESIQVDRTDIFTAP